ncbi:HHL152Cp [Eremothecium sinecaudum]|uniref:HHL152Cp n=1 Tax=Eremothecium sinecaudum TaxID=45286 RepID=A0A109V0C2_9SACH|nr:HHL152Cp [Eremothecium sinecaudum]AMD22618.1 HHL152Cp [Eremothecium sinecaudum]
MGMPPSLHSQEMQTTFTGPVQSYPWTRHSDEDEDDADKAPQPAAAPVSSAGGGGEIEDSITDVAASPYMPSASANSVPPTPMAANVNVNAPISTGVRLTAKTCPVCLKAFTRKTSLNTHMLIHADIRPYRCRYNDCNKTFNVKSNLNRHLKIHKKQELLSEKSSLQDTDSGRSSEL